MTEQEAKGKWCPYANSSAVPAERLPPGSNDVTQAHARCIGSACMAWRWSYTPEEAAGNRNGPQGFCGLAGVPL